MAPTFPFLSSTYYSLRHLSVSTFTWTWRWPVDSGRWAIRPCLRRWATVAHVIGWRWCCCCCCSCWSPRTTSWVATRQLRRRRRRDSNPIDIARGLAQEIGLCTHSNAVEWWNYRSDCDYRSGMTLDCCRSERLHEREEHVPRMSRCTHTLSQPASEWMNGEWGQDDENEADE